MTGDDCPECGRHSDCIRRSAEARSAMSKSELRDLKRRWKAMMEGRGPIAIPIPPPRVRRTHRPANKSRRLG